jgi:hypothetical protein
VAWRCYPPAISSCQAGNGGLAQACPQHSVTDRQLQDVYGKDKTPDFTREGGSIGVTLILQEKLGVDVVLIPMGRSDDGAQWVILRLIHVIIMNQSDTALSTRNWTNWTSSKAYVMSFSLHWEVVVSTFLFRRRFSGRTYICLQQCNKRGNLSPDYKMDPKRICMLEVEYNYQLAIVTIGWFKHLQLSLNSSLNLALLLTFQDLNFPNRSWGQSWGILKWGFQGWLAQSQTATQLPQLLLQFSPLGYELLKSYQLTLECEKISLPTMPLRKAMPK